MEIYGETVICGECESDNVVERWRETYSPVVGTTDYPVALCLTCGHEVSV